MAHLIPVSMFCIAVSAVALPGPCAQARTGPVARGASATPVPAPVAPATRPLRFGPFAVLDTSHVALVDVTDSRSPAAFMEMMRRYPAIREIEMRDCPGTVDDAANLRLGRMIRRYRIATRVPEKGSVRSGAIELFLAGAERKAASTARFVIHAWRVEGAQTVDGPQLAATMKVTYTNYYRAMGMAADGAEEFYRRTMAVPARAGLSLPASEIARYVAIGQVPAARVALAGAQQLPG